MAFKSFCESQPPVTHKPWSPPPAYYPPANQATTNTNVTTTNITNVEYNNTVFNATNNTTNNYIVHESYENNVHHTNNPSNVNVEITNNNSSNSAGPSIEDNSETNTNTLSNNFNGNEILSGNSISTGSIASPSVNIGDVNLGLLESVNVLNGATTTVLGAPLVTDILNGGLLNTGDVDLLNNLIGDIDALQNTGTLLDASGLLQEGVNLDLLTDVLSGNVLGVSAPIELLTDLVDVELTEIVSSPVDVAAALIDGDLTNVISAPLDVLTGDLLAGGVLTGDVLTGDVLGGNLNSVIAAPVEIADGLLGGDVTSILNAPLEIGDGVLGGDLTALASAPLNIVAPILSGDSISAPLDILSDLSGNATTGFNLFDGASFGENLISALTGASSIEGLDIANIATDVTGSPLTLINAFTDADISNALSQLSGIGGGNNIFDIDLSSLGATIMDSMMGDSGPHHGGLSGILTQIDLFDIGDFGHGAHAHG